MSIKAILFDLDGVLIDAKEWHYESLNQALLMFGIQPISRELHLSRFDGLSTRDKLLQYGPTKNSTKELINRIYKAKQELTLAIINEKAKPNFEHIKMFNELVELNLILGCCSNSLRQTVSLSLEKINLASYMNFALSNEDVLLAKPSNEIYLKAISMMKLDPKEVLILEDNPRGIKSAIDSGAYIMEIGLLEDVNFTNISYAIKYIESEKFPNQLIRPKIRMARLNEMIKGYFVGNFYPSILQTDSFECGIKVYKKGDKEGLHFHKIATEITVVISGKVIMCNREIKTGEMILMEPGIETSFEALEDTITCVIKTPSNNNDKFNG
jgi:beta-phosphoglucomutase